MYDDEVPSAGVVTGVKGFKKAVSNINFLFNWSYVDSEHIAYALSGAMPQRARGTSANSTCMTRSCAQHAGPFASRGGVPSWRAFVERG